MQDLSKLQILVFSETPLSLREVMAWFSLAGHNTKLCHESNVFLNELTKSETEYDIAFVEAKENNLTAILEKIQLSQALNIYDQNKKKAKFILYGNMEISSINKDTINDVQATVISLTDNQTLLFEAVGSVLNFGTNISSQWSDQLETKLKNSNNNVLQFKPAH